MRSRGLQREFFSTEDIAEYLGIAPYTVRELCRTGKLQHVRLGRMIRIRKDWADTFAKTTGRDEFVWVMSDRLRRALEQRRFLGPEGYVFGTEDGRCVRKFHDTWKALFRAAGLPADLRWHDARHEFVSSLIEEGGTIQEVKEAARHKSITTTAKYMKAHEEKLKALLERRAARVKASGQLQGNVAS